MSSEASRDIQVRLTPPRVAVVSTHHYVNQGGAEMVVYRVTPARRRIGCASRRRDLSGIPGLGRRAYAIPSCKVAFFALLYNQTPDTPMEIFARDIAGNQTRAQFEHRVFPKKFRNSRIPLDDKFLSRVVPSILQIVPAAEELSPRRSPAGVPQDQQRSAPDEQRDDCGARQEDGADDSLGGRVPAARRIAGRIVVCRLPDVPLRRQRSRPPGASRLRPREDGQCAGHGGQPRQGGVRAPSSASTATPSSSITAWGVQSLYAHLSSFAVREGDDVKKGQTLGASGQTGLAGGDHLHFSMLVNGQFVNATEWWDPHWIEDRIMRKLREAGLPAEAAPRRRPEAAMTSHPTDAEKLSCVLKLAFRQRPVAVRSASARSSAKPVPEAHAAVLRGSAITGTATSTARRSTPTAPARATSI